MKGTELPALIVAALAAGCSGQNPVAPASSVPGSDTSVSATSAQSANAASRSVSEVRRFSDESLVPGASATLVRNGSSVTLTVHTSDLEPGAAYTVWWVIFNVPSACSGGECGEDDLFNAAVQSSVLHATGHIVPPSGKGNFGASLTAGGPTGQVLFGPGLLDAREAEIHIVIRTHGPAIPGLVPAQISSFEGACDVNVCEDVQFAVFKS